MIRPNFSIWLTKPTPEVMLMGIQVLSPTFSVLIDATDPSVTVVHSPASRNSGNRSLGVREVLQVEGASCSLFCCSLELEAPATLFVLLLICAES